LLDPSPTPGKPISPRSAFNRPEKLFGRIRMKP
jgi:hypothetical protein